ncbi:MAG: capsid assembly protein [Candidatus Thorarchaeota archaeon]|jgi:hypothetical protein
MAEITFEGTDPAVAEARQAEEARLVELGDKLIAEEESRNLAKYEQAQKDAEAELRYAGKFKSAEDLEKAYKELEKKLGQKEETSSEDNDEESTEDVPVEEPEEAVSETAKFIQEASEEYFSNSNQLTPETVQKLKELPSEQLIDAYLELQKNATVQPQQLSDADANAILNSVGGESAYNETLAWAADNLKPEEVAAFDNVVNSGNKDAIFFAVQALNQRYKDTVGFEGKRVSGKSVKNTSVKGFRSQAELARAISDARYRDDPGYRLEIEQKLAASGDLL